jgi:hypothetical protein
MTEEVKKPGKAVERVTVLECHRNKLTNLTDQANAAMGGIASISKSDVANMILGDHADTLSREEIERLRTAHVDQVKLALWLADAAREAKKTGEPISLKELLERCESSLAPRKPRAAPRTKKASPSVVDDAEPQAEKPQAE